MPKENPYRRPTRPWFATSTAVSGLIPLVGAMVLSQDGQFDWKDLIEFLALMVCSVYLLGTSAALWREWATGPARKRPRDIGQ